MQKQKAANGVQHNSPGCNPGNRAPKHIPMPHPNGVLCGLRCWTPLGFFFLFWCSDISRGFSPWTQGFSLGLDVEPRWGSFFGVVVFVYISRGFSPGLNVIPLQGIFWPPTGSHTFKLWRPRILEPLGVFFGPQRGHTFKPRVPPVVIQTNPNPKPRTPTGCYMPFLDLINSLKYMSLWI